MSDDRIVHTVDDSNRRTSHPVQSYQSVWMSHWMRTSCNVTAEKLNCESNASGNEKLDADNKDNHLRHEMEILRSRKVLGVIETRTSKMMNDSLTMSTEILGTGGFGSSILNHDQETCEYVPAPRPVVGHHFEHSKAVDIKGGFRFPSVRSEHVNSSRRYKFPDEGTSKNPLVRMKTNSFSKDSCSAGSKPLQKIFSGSSSQVPYKLDLEKSESHKGKKDSYLIGKAAIISNEQWQNTNLSGLEHERCGKDSHSANLVCGREKDGPSQPDNFYNEWFRQSNTPFLFDIPSTSDHPYAAFNQEFFQKMQNRSALRMSPDRHTDSEKTEAMKSFYDCYPLHKFQNCVRNVETMRICATLEEGIPGCYPRVITKVSGNTQSAVHSVSPFYNQSKGGVILQPLSSSTDSEGKGNAGHAKTSKVTINNESSAETDTMDMEFFKEKNLHSVANSCPSDKAFKMDLELSHRIDVSSREAESQQPCTSLPDINLELPALPASARSSESSGPSSSKTQSLEMDILVAHAEKLSKLESNICPDDFPNAHPDNRWVKRLKLSSSQSSSQGPKCSNLAENSSNQEMKEYVSRILTSGYTSSEPIARKHSGKQSMVSDKRDNLSKENEEIMTDPLKKNKELLLSQAWIKRWLHDGSRISPTNSGTMMVCEPQSPRLDVEELQKKQCPSIGAMALMGKAMRGFQPCNPQKRGSLTVWNTKAV